MNKADTVFMIISAGLVLLMTPGLALFYAGMGKGQECAWYHHAESFYDIVDFH